MENILKIMTAVMALSFVNFALCGTNELDRVDALDNICSYIPSDNLDEEDQDPTPDEILSRYGITTNALVQDLKVIVSRHSPAITNFYERIPRCNAVCWIGTYGSTNDLAYLSMIVTNSTDYAQDSAIGASMNILKHSPELIAFARGIVTNEVTFSANTRRWVYCCLERRCVVGMSDNYIDHASQHARIAAFFLERAALETLDPLFIDRCTYTLNPSYRHSQQRRDNLAALRPPGLTGRRAELYDAAQRDAAQSD